MTTAPAAWKSHLLKGQSECTSMHRVFGCCFSLGFLAYLFLSAYNRAMLRYMVNTTKKEVGPLTSCKWSKTAQDQVYGLPAQVSCARIWWWRCVHHHYDHLPLMEILRILNAEMGQARKSRELWVEGVETGLGSNRLLSMDLNKTKKTTHIPHINFTYVYSFVFLGKIVMNLSSWLLWASLLFVHHHNHHHHPRCSKLTASKFDLPSLIRCRDQATSRAQLGLPWNWLKICDSKTFGSLGGSHLPGGWLIVGVVSVFLTKVIIYGHSWRNTSGDFQMAMFSFSTTAVTLVLSFASTAFAPRFSPITFAMPCIALSLSSAMTRSFGYHGPGFAMSCPIPDCPYAHAGYWSTAEQLTFRALALRTNYHNLGHCTISNRPKPVPDAWNASVPLQLTRSFQRKPFSQNNKGDHTSTGQTFHRHRPTVETSPKCVTSMLHSGTPYETNLNATADPLHHGEIQGPQLHLEQLPPETKTLLHHVQPHYREHDQWTMMHHIPGSTLTKIIERTPADGAPGTEPPLQHQIPVHQPSMYLPRPHPNTTMFGELIFSHPIRQPNQLRPFCRESSSQSHTWSYHWRWRQRRTRTASSTPEHLQTSSSTRPNTRTISTNLATTTGTCQRPELRPSCHLGIRSQLLASRCTSDVLTPHVPHITRRGHYYYITMQACFPLQLLHTLFKKL